MRVAAAVAVALLASVASPARSDSGDRDAEIFGEPGRHARTAIGVTNMPFGVAIEVEAQMRVDPA